MKRESHEIQNPTIKKPFSIVVCIQCILFVAMLPFCGFMVVKQCEMRRIHFCVLFFREQFLTFFRYFLSIVCCSTSLFPKESSRISGQFEAFAVTPTKPKERIRKMSLLRFFSNPFQIRNIPCTYQHQMLSYSNSLEKNPRVRPKM